MYIMVLDKVVAAPAEVLDDVVAAQWLSSPERTAEGSDSLDLDADN